MRSNSSRRALYEDIFRSLSIYETGMASGLEGDMCVQATISGGDSDFAGGPVCDPVCARRADHYGRKKTQRGCPSIGTSYFGWCCFISHMLSCAELCHRK